MIIIFFSGNLKQTCQQWAPIARSSACSASSGSWVNASAPGAGRDSRSSSTGGLNAQVTKHYIRELTVLQANIHWRYQNYQPKPWHSRKATLHWILSNNDIMPRQVALVKWVWQKTHDKKVLGSKHHAPFLWIKESFDQLGLVASAVLQSHHLMMVDL